MDRCTLNGSDVPSDIWWRIMTKCGPDEIMSLEKCCRALHHLAKSRSIWLECLQNLGPYEPPSMPKHVSPISLSTSELRSISINARQRTSLWETDSLPEITRETVVSLKDANPGEVLGEPIHFGLQLFLLPGGNYLMIYWPAGYLQCWSVCDNTCLWVYPDLPEGASEDRPKLLWNFDFDMQQPGDVHILLIDEFLQNDHLGNMFPNIMRFSPGTSTFENFHSGQQLNKGYGVPSIVKLQGDVTVMYHEFFGSSFGTLTISSWKENKHLAVFEVKIDCLEVAENFIICVCKLNSGDKSLSVISLTDMLKMATSMSEPPKTVSLADVMYAAILLEPKSFSLQNAKLSVNTLHWKTKRDRDKIFITVLYKDTVTRGSPSARFVLHKSRDRSGSSDLPRLETLSFEDDNGEALKLSERTFASYTSLTPPTLSGQSLVLLHSGHVPTEGDDKFALATLSFEGKIKIKPLDLGTDYSALRAPCTEFYSGAILFATEDYSSVVIKHFD